MVKTQCVNIRHLRHGGSDLELKSSLLDLFNKCLKIGISRKHISLHTRNQEHFATVTLQTQDEVVSVQQLLKDRFIRNELGFKFLRIAEMYVEICVDAVELPEKYYEVGKEIVKEKTRQAGIMQGDDEWEEHLIRYVISFPNSQIKGTIYIGVTDNYKVIEIPVKGKKKLERHYSDRQGNIYIQIDGGVPTLSPKAAQDWVLQMYVRTIWIMNLLQSKDINVMYSSFKLTSPRIRHAVSCDSDAGGGFLRTYY